METQPAVVQQYEGAEGWWEISTRPPAPPLRPWIAVYQGYAEVAHVTLARRHLPIDAVVLIIGFGEALRFTTAGGSLARAPRQSFVGGLSDTYVTSEWEGLSSGIQVNLSPPGARMLLGQPLEAMTNGVIALDDIFGPAAPLLAERLYEAGEWDARFDILDRVFMRQLARVTPPPAILSGTWDRLAATDGAIEIEQLAEACGWSRRHLSERFRTEFGLAPKRMSRVLRFNRALALLEEEPGSGDAAAAPAWSRIAAASGYYDQSHLVRDFRQFSGYTPGQYYRRRITGMLDVLDG